MTRGAAHYWLGQVWDGHRAVFAIGGGPGGTSVYYETSADGCYTSRFDPSSGEDETRWPEPADEVTVQTGPRKKRRIGLLAASLGSVRLGDGEYALATHEGDGYLIYLPREVIYVQFWTRQGPAPPLHVIAAALRRLPAPSAAMLARSHPPDPIAAMLVGATKGFGLHRAPPLVSRVCRVAGVACPSLLPRPSTAVRLTPQQQRLQVVPIAPRGGTHSAVIFYGRLDDRPGHEASNWPGHAFHLVSLTRPTHVRLSPTSLTALLGHHDASLATPLGQRNLAGHAGLLYRFPPRWRGGGLLASHYLFMWTHHHALNAIALRAWSPELPLVLLAAELQHLTPAGE